MTKLKLQPPFVGKTKWSVDKKKKVFLGNNKEVLNVELWILLEALDIAIKTTNMKITLITIFCDLQKALKTIVFFFICQENRFLRILIY